MKSKLLIGAAVCVVAVFIVLQLQTLKKERNVNQQLHDRALAASTSASAPELPSEPTDPDEISRLRTEVEALKTRGTDKVPAEVKNAQLELAQARKRRIKLESEIKAAEVRTHTTTAMKMIALGAQVSLRKTGAMPSRFEEFTNNIGKIPSSVSLDKFELVPHERPISTKEPALYFAWEKEPRQLPDGTYEKAYALVDGSVITQRSPTPDFSQLEQQGIARKEQ